jgi:hypothetical protein
MAMCKSPASMPALSAAKSVTAADFQDKASEAEFRRGAAHN